MKTRYVIYTRFNSDHVLSKKYHVALTKEWIKHRMELFNRYTRKCLQLQTNQDFLNIVHIHPDSKLIVEQELLNHPPLPKNIIFTSDKITAIENYLQDADQLFISNLDSDDLYNPHFVQFLHDYKPKENTSALICQRGYIFNSQTHIVDKYFSSSPPFFTQIYTAEEYLSYAKYYPPLAHGYMRFFNYEAITEPMYMIVLHDQNTWPKYKLHVPRCFGNEQPLSNWKEILKEYDLLPEDN